MQVWGDVAATGMAKAGAVVVVLDNDECIGAWRTLGTMYSFLGLEGDMSPKTVSRFVAAAEAAECFRPGLRTLLDVVVRLRGAGRVHAVVMCTMGRGRWVPFLKLVVEAWYGAPVYDFVVDQAAMTAHRSLGSSTWCTHDTHGHAYVKNMDHVRAITGLPEDLALHWFVVDDRCDSVVCGAHTALTVTPYVRTDADVVPKLLPEDLGTTQHRLALFAQYRTWAGGCTKKAPVALSDPSVCFQHAADELQRVCGVVGSENTASSVGPAEINVS
jgi:hypothetical protein